jgi:two-component sensor histidine kinase
MSIIHHHLYTGENLSQVHLAQYVANLCENLQASYRPRQQDIRLHQDIAELFLDVSVMIPLGLILNELLTNAFKYAFPDRERGNIWVRIAEEEDGLMVVVRDDGVGMQPSAVRKKGFGTRLIQAFLRKLEAESETIHLDQGTEIRILIRDYLKNSALRQVG